MNNSGRRRRGPLRRAQLSTAVPRKVGLGISRGFLSSAVGLCALLGSAWAPKQKNLWPGRAQTFILQITQWAAAAAEASGGSNSCCCCCSQGHLHKGDADSRATRYRGQAPHGVLGQCLKVALCTYSKTPL
ncbi:unnamed protein product [Lampetra fluviatilis]